MNAVVHCKRDEYDVLIDRTTKWGNPFPLQDEAEREVCLDKYRAYLLGNRELMAALPELRGKTLGCWCAPRLCHGDVLIETLHLQDERIAVKMSSGISEADAIRQTHEEQAAYPQAPTTTACGSGNPQNPDCTNHSNSRTGGESDWT